MSGNEKEPKDAPVWLDAEEANAWADGYNAANREAAAALTAAEARIKMLEAELAHNERRHAHELEVAQSHIAESARSAEPVAEAYRIAEPENGFRSHGSFTPGEKAKLRPIAETLAMLDGNAFFGMAAGDFDDWSDQYLPEAAALYEANGGDGGWAGRVSFAAAILAYLSARSAEPVAWIADAEFERMRQGGKHAYGYVYRSDEAASLNGLGIGGATPLYAAPTLSPSPEQPETSG